MIVIVIAVSLGLGWLAGEDSKSDSLFGTTKFLVVGGAVAASLVLALVVAFRARWLSIVLVAGWAAGFIGYAIAPSRYHSLGTITLDIASSSARTVTLSAECWTGAPGSQRVIQVSASGIVDDDRVDIYIGLAGSAADDKYRFGLQGFRISIDLAPDNATGFDTLGFIWVYEHMSQLADGLVPTDADHHAGEIPVAAAGHYLLEGTAISEPSRWPDFLDGRLRWTCGDLQSF